VFSKENISKLKVLSSEMDQAKSGLIPKLLLKGRRGDFQLILTDPHPVRAL
jgi:hypothetical protein